MNTVFLVHQPPVWLAQYHPHGEQPLPPVTCQNLRIACDKALIAIATTSRKTRCVVEAGGQSIRLNRKIVKALAENYPLWWIYNRYGYKLVARTAFHERGSITTRILTPAMKFDAANALHKLLGAIGANLDALSLVLSVDEYDRNRVYSDKEALTRYQTILAQRTKE